MGRGGALRRVELRVELCLGGNAEDVGESDESVGPQGVGVPRCRYDRTSRSPTATSSRINCVSGNLYQSAPSAARAPVLLRLLRSQSTQYGPVRLRSGVQQLHEPRRDPRRVPVQPLARRQDRTRLPLW